MDLHNELLLNLDFLMNDQRALSKTIKWIEYYLKIQIFEAAL